MVQVGEKAAGGLSIQLGGWDGAGFQDRRTHVRPAVSVCRRQVAGMGGGPLQYGQGLPGLGGCGRGVGVDLRRCGQGQGQQLGALPQPPLDHIIGQGVGGNGVEGAGWSGTEGAFEGGGDAALKIVLIEIGGQVGG